MNEKQLKDKAIKIKGKDYVLVSDRVAYFNEQYPTGSITTELISEPNSEMVIVKATVKPYWDEKVTDYTVYTGHSQAVIGDGMVNKTAALENAETSAVGRALGFMGIGVIESIASADEMNKSTTNTMRFATEKQINFIRTVAGKISGLEQADDIDKWVEEQLTLAPAKIPIFKVDGAIKKLRDIEREQMEQDRIRAVTVEDHVEVTDQDLSDLDNGKLPY